MIVLNYIIAIVFTGLWVIGFFTHLAGGSIHFLLAGAFALILLNILQQDNKSKSNNKHLTN